MTAKKKVALIGGAGFIGHNLASALSDAGHIPVVIDGFTVNNLLAFTDTGEHDKSLYRSIINERKS